MNLHESIVGFCRSSKIKLDKDLGQHFLIDQSVLDAIMYAAALKGTDNVLEIGPGIGVLTLELVRAAKSVTAIELDPRFPPLLSQYILQNGSEDLLRKLEIIEGNALNVPFPETPYKIVANIPYHITSPLLRHAFVESALAPTSLTLLIQREVAERISSWDDAGLLTIMVHAFGTPHIVRHVPPGSFLPPPAVDSSVLHIQSHAKPIADQSTLDELFRLAKMSFAQKRKMLRNTLGNLPDKPDLLSKANIDPSRRPQTLTMEEWLLLAKISMSQ